MKLSSRRRQLLLSAASGAALSVFPPSIQRALAIPANRATGTLNDVEHVVILMQENRSFDHYLGTLPGVRGYADRFTIPQSNGASIWQQSNAERVVAPYYLDYRHGNALLAGGPHTWPDAHAAWDHGRMSRWPAAKSLISMGHLSQADLPFHFALANAFTVCDAYYCSMQGGTTPNRMFLFTGSNGPTPAGVAVINNDDWDSFASSTTGLAWTTYPERLAQAGVSWKVYQNLPDNYTDNPLAGFKRYRVLHEMFPELAVQPYVPEMEGLSPLCKGVANTLPDGGFLGALRDDVKAGRLPQVSWIVAPKAYCEHPEVSTPGQGAWYIQQVIEALISDPAVWSKTVLIVNYDENDCFFDHMPPPVAPSRNPDSSLAGASTVDTAAEYFTHPTPPGNSGTELPDGLPYGPGPRVPMFVISPWSRGGWVNSQVFDHTSVLRFLEQRFGVVETNISPWRRAVFGDLTSAFDFSGHPQTQLPPLPKQEKRRADSLSAQQHKIERIPVPVPPHSDLLVSQARARRPSRALPYEIQVHASAAASTLSLSLVNSGSAAVVLHVYDRLHLERVPRRYTIEAGRQLTDSWETAAEGGAYDLWLLGPNGFHRAFQGRLGATVQAAQLEVHARYDKSQNILYLTLMNPSAASADFVVSAQAYFKDDVKHLTLDPQSNREIQRELAASGGWYDFLVSSSDGFARRFAGRLETGAHSISDPAMGA